MFSKIVTITFAVSFISVTSGFVINAKLRVLEPILKCYETEDTTAVSAFEKAIEKEHKETFADDLKLTCLSMEKYEACLADVIKAKSPPVPIVFYFYAALAYQTTFLLKKANLCPHITYDGLKKITEESGILGKEKLHNIENDKYVKCAGDAVEKCLIHHVDMSAAAKEGSGDYAYVKCMKKEAKSCKAVILRHIVDQLEAYKRHLKRLMELEKLEGL